MTIRLIAFLVAEQEQAVIARLQPCSVDGTSFISRGGVK